MSFIFLQIKFTIGSHICNFNRIINIFVSVYKECCQFVITWVQILWE